MLIVLSGAETIKKTLLSATINAALNSLKPKTIFYDQFYKNLLDYTINTHYKMKFRAIMADYGIQQDILFPEGGNYEEFLKSYNERPYNYLVISGSFSKSFVNLIKKDIQEVEVINITRNPSVSYLLDTIAFDNVAPYNTNMNLKLLKKRYNTSSIQQVILKYLPNVQTIKFEDIIATGTMTINNNLITIPNEYKIFNNHITQQEYKNINFCQLISNDIDDFNQAYSNFNIAFSNGRDDVPLDIIPKLPKNIFADLDYIPLTYNEITCPLL